MSPCGAPVYCSADGDVAVMAPPPPRWLPNLSGGRGAVPRVIYGSRTRVSAAISPQPAPPPRMPQQPHPLSSRALHQPFLFVPPGDLTFPVSRVCGLSLQSLGAGHFARVSLWRGLRRPRYAARRTEEPICHAVLSRVVTFCGEPQNITINYPRRRLVIRTH